MSKSGLQRRLLESHLTIAFAGILIILVLCVAAAMMGRSGAKLFESTGPIPNSSLSLINGLQASIAANHGWVYLGDRKFIEENRIAWANIETTLTTFQDVVDGEVEVISPTEVDQVADSIARLRDLQAGIAYVPNSGEKSPSEVYSSSIKPAVLEVRELLSQLNSDVFPEQRVLLSIEKYFTETALQLELSIKSREYIDSQEYVKARDKLVLSTIPIAHKIAIDELGTEHILATLNSAIKEFVEKSDQVNITHQVESNNQVRQFLFEHAVPLSNNVINVLQEVVSRSQTQAEIRREAIKKFTTFSLLAAVAALAGLIVSTIVLSINNSNKIVSRLGSLADAVGGFSQNDNYSPILVKGNDEISNLARLFNVMALAINEKQKALKSYQNELEHRVARRTRELFSAKEFAETTLRSVGDALITVDHDLLISTFNPAAERLLQVSADRAVGQPLTSMVVLHHADDEVFDLTNAIDETMRTKQLFSTEETLLFGRDTSNAISVKVSLAPIVDMKANNGGTILILRNVEREMALQSELSYQANHDPLTGLKNRASFNSEVESLLSGKKGSARTHVIAFLDLDKFKVVNDSCGHAAGDELLKQISHLLSLNLRSGDMLARLGGDEFAIMLHDCDIESGESIALNLRDRVANHRFSWDGRVFSVGVSIGITECSPSSKALKDILTEADIACYAAKEAGRNKVRVSKFKHIGAIENVEYKLLGQESLEQAFQQELPELKLEDLQATFEPNGNPLYAPSLEFFDESGSVIASHKVQTAVERAGLQSAYDGCLLTKALAIVSLNQQSVDSSPFAVIIDLSDALLSDDALFEQLASDLEQNSIKPETLYFSFSEHAIFKNLESARKRLDVLRGYGVQTIMQDFSGSFSFIASIRGLSIDYLHIDPAIVQDILLNPVHHIVVRTICELAHVSGRKTIVVGDFEPRLHDELVELGVNVILPSKLDMNVDSGDGASVNSLTCVKAS